MNELLDHIRDKLAELTRIAEAFRLEDPAIADACQNLAQTLATAEKAIAAGTDALQKAREDHGRSQNCVPITIRERVSQR